MQSIYCIYYLHIILNIIIFSESLYTLTAPATYVAFSGDLHVQYSIPSNISLPNAFIRLISLGTNNKPVEITTLSVPLGVSASQLPVTCGIIEYAGDFALRLYMHSDGAMLAERLITVVWPKVDIIIPEEHVALTKGVSVVIKSQARCRSLLHRYSLRLDLVHLGGNASNQGSSRSDISYSENLPMFTDSNVLRTFPCYAFDYVGSYQVLYKSSYKSGSVIARSNILRATWSRNYHINFYSNTVFPCNGAVAVLYTQPECPGQDDKIRMFSMVRSTSGSPAAPIEYVYVAERRAVGKNEHVSFDCDLFKKDVTGYCFAYVSIARSGAVMEQKRFCVPAKEDAGEWGIVSFGRV